MAYRYCQSVAAGARSSRIRTQVLSSMSPTIQQLDLLDLRAMLGFERWQSANKGLPLGSVMDHLGSIDGVEASRINY